MSTTTTTGTLAAGSSKTFTLAPGGAVSLTLSPNIRVTITETPESVSGSGVGGNTSRVHEPQLPGTFAYGPYAMGGVVVVAVASNSGSSVAWTRKDTVVTMNEDSTSLVSGDGKTFGLNRYASVMASPYRIACWGQERAAGTDSNTPEVIGATRFTDIRSPYWFCANRGDAILVAEYGILDGGTGITAANWNSTSRSQGKTFSSLASKAPGIDAVIFNYGGTDIVAGNGTTPTAATVLGYLRANILAIMRLGLPVIVESIYPYMDVSVYRGVTSGWTAAGSGTAAQKQAIADSVNTQLQAWIANFPYQAVFVDVATTLKDGGTYAAKKYMIDGIELNMRGAMLVGKMVADATYALLPSRRAFYLGDVRTVTPEAIALTPTGFTNYSGSAGSQGTISWGTPTVGFDTTYGPYFEVTATCSAITGLTAKNITNVTWAAGRLTFTVASHNMIPSQKFTTTGLTGANVGAMNGPFTVDSNDSETTYSVLYPTDPGAITIAGSPPSASSQTTVQEAYATMSIFTEFIKNNGTPATGITLSAGDMLESTCWTYADDGAGGTPPLDSFAIRQRLYYQAGTPTSIFSDGGIFGPTSGNAAFQAAFGPVRQHTPRMVSANTSGGGSANVSNANGSMLQFIPVFNAVGSARCRIYSPSLRVVQPGPIVISTPATGVAYVNKYPVPLRIVVGVNGATISASTVSRGDANNLYPAGVTSGGTVVLAPNDSLILTYTVATPTMTGFIDGTL